MTPKKFTVALAALVVAFSSAPAFAQFSLGGSWGSNFADSDFLSATLDFSWNSGGLFPTTSDFFGPQLHSIVGSPLNSITNSLGQLSTPTSLPSLAGPFFPTAPNSGGLPSIWPGSTSPIRVPSTSVPLPGGGSIRVGGGSISPTGVRLPNAQVRFPGGGSITFPGGSTGGGGGGGGYSAARSGTGSDARSAGAMGELGSDHNSSADDANAAWYDHWNEPYAPSLQGVQNGRSNKSYKNDQATSNMLDTPTSTMLLAPGTVTDRPYPSRSFDLGFTNGGYPSDGGPWFGQDQLMPYPTATTSVDADITNGYE